MNEEFMNTFDKVLGDIDNRFRDKDFFLNEEEEAIITEWIDYQINQLKERGGIDAENFMNIINLLEVLERSSESDSFWLRQHIYTEVYDIKNECQ